MRNPNLVKQIPEHLKKCIKILESEIQVSPVPEMISELQSLMDETKRFIEQEEKLNAFD